MNIIQEANLQLINKKWGPPLWYYNQANCQCTLTDNGYRIYRPPNITYNSSDNTTRTMWGGFILQFPNPPLIEGHSYEIIFDITGKTTQIPSSVYWNNNAGWGGGSYGLSTDITDVSIKNIPANFNSTEWVPVSYRWKVNGPIYKTCTTSYSSFVAGTTYSVWRDFKYGFDYQNTGALGTDLYIKNLRMYDLTIAKQIDITKHGIINADSFVETPSKQDVAFHHSGEITSNQFYEI